MYACVKPSSPRGEGELPDSCSVNSPLFKLLRLVFTIIHFTSSFLNVLT